MITPFKYIDLEDTKKDKDCIKTQVPEDLKKEFKKILESTPIKIKVTLKKPDWLE